MLVRRVRPVTIADMLVVISALAIGLGLGRTVVVSVYDGMPRASAARTYAVVEVGSPCVAFALMHALVLLRLKRPRPKMSILLRQPGFAACCAGVVALVVGMATTLAVRDTRGISTPSSFWWACMTWADSMVPGAWLLLALSGRWRAQRDWLDRLGRLLGAFWVLHLVHYEAGYWFARWWFAL